MFKRKRMVDQTSLILEKTNVPLIQTHMFGSCSQIHDGRGREGYNLIRDPSKLSITSYFNYMKPVKHIHLVWESHGPNLDLSSFNLDLFFVHTYKYVRTYRTSLRYYNPNTVLWHAYCAITLTLEELTNFLAVLFPSSDLVLLLLGF